MIDKKWPSSVFNRIDSYGVVSKTFKDRPNGKLVVLGFPKSGNTWLVSLLCDYFDIVPIAPDHDVSLQGGGMSHQPFGKQVSNRKDFMNCVSIVRDPRAVVNSYYHYSQTEVYKEYHPSFCFTDIYSFYYEYFLSQVAPIGHFDTFTSVYSRLGVPVVRFEDLKENPFQSITKLLTFWRVEVDEAKLMLSIENNTFKRLKANGKQLADYMDPSHFRSGKVNSYVDELPVDIIEDIEIRFAGLMARWNYKPSTEQGNLARLRTLSMYSTEDDARLIMRNNPPKYQYIDLIVEAYDNAGRSGMKSAMRLVARMTGLKRLLRKR